MLTATASNGAVLSGWSGCGGGSGATWAVSGTVASSDGGINCGPTCAAAYDSGTLVMLTASASGGWRFGGWSGCDGVSGTTCTVMRSGARSVTATFTVQRFTLTVSKGGTGSGTVTSSDSDISCGSTGAATYDNGTGATLTATAAPGAGFLCCSWG